jgi:thiamine biosynthesis lipoprotein
VTGPPARAQWAALGTSASVYVSTAEALAPARSIVEAELAAIDLACSRFRADSGLSRLNAAGGREVEVSPLLLEAILVALRAAALTGGAVDPTITDALELAGYDVDFDEVRARHGPIRLARVPGWRTVGVDRARGTVTLARGARLDLGATAKALAADRSAAAAAAALPGIGVLVNLGGDIATSGPAPAGGWEVRVAEDHRATADAPGQTCTLRSGALASSSSTVRRWGPRAHHLIDPRTGTPADGPWRSATVAAATCVDANTASTATVVGGAAAVGWLQRCRLPARLVARDGTVHAVGGWPAAA